MFDKKVKFRKFLNLRELISTAAERYGDKPYLKYLNDDKSISEISFFSFAAMVEQLSTFFLSLGSDVNRIALLSENRHEWILCYCAAVASGKVIVPLDKELAYEQAESFAMLSDADVFIYSGHYASNVLETAAKDTKIKLFLAMDGGEETLSNDNRFRTLSEALHEGLCLLSEGSTLYKKARTDSTRMCAIIFTSGTTGTSKGVMLSEDNLLSCIQASSNMVDIGEEDTIFSVLPFHHTYETCCGLLTPLCIGCTVCLNNSLKYVLRNMKLFAPTAMVLVPLFVSTIYKKIQEEIRKQHKENILRGGIAVTRTARKIGIDLRRVVFKQVHQSLGGRLRNIICGGAALDPMYVEKFEELGITVAQGYGITECAPLVSVVPFDAIKYASVGIPIEGSIVKIVSEDENGAEYDMDCGEIGEICVKGPNVMLGYYNNPEATADAFNKEGFFKTGDYGYLDEDGYLYITGRKKNIIIFDNGKNVYPEEIEEYLYHIDTIVECVVVAREIAGEQLLTAVIYPDFTRFAGKTDDEIKEEIKASVSAINKQLPSFKQIRNIELKKTEFEKTSTKKIMRYKV